LVQDIAKKNSAMDEHGQNMDFVSFKHTQEALQLFYLCESVAKKFNVQWSIVRTFA